MAKTHWTVSPMVNHFNRKTTENKNNIRFWYSRTSFTAGSSLNPTSPQETNDKIYVCKISKLILSKLYIILKTQRLENKQCRSRWGGSLWATSSGSTLFENSTTCSFFSGTFSFDGKLKKPVLSFQISLLPYGHSLELWPRWLCSALSFWSMRRGRADRCKMKMILLMLMSEYIENIRPWGYKKNPCSTQPSMKCFLLINVKMPTFVGILTFMSWKNSILLIKAEFLDIFILKSI